jgi:DNA invertase Pin-like site-specific DNA recombinase
MAADQKEILRRLEAGEPPSQVAMAMNVTVSTVYRIRRTAGIVTEHDNARVARESRAEQAPRVREMLGKGMSPTQVCAQMEIGYDTFRKITSEHGIETTKGRTGRPTLKGRLFPEAARLHEGGMSQTEISREINVPLGTLSRWFHEEGIRIYRIDRDPHRDKSGNFGSTPGERSAAASAGGTAAAESLENRTCDYAPCGRVFTRGRTGSGRMTRDRYCSPEHFYAHRREESGATTTYTCGFCGKEFQWWTRQPRKYCSQEHYMKANKSVPKYGFNGQVLESGYEAAFVGLCSLRGIQFEFFDRIEAVEWAPGGWYGPDFVIRSTDSLYIDTKGWKDATQKWQAFREQRGPLAILRKEDLDELFLLPTAAQVLAAIKAKATEQETT